MPMNPAVFAAVKKTILDTADQSDFARVHDCIVDVLGIKPSDRQVRAIVGDFINTAQNWL